MRPPCPGDASVYYDLTSVGQMQCAIFGVALDLTAQHLDRLFLPLLERAPEIGAGLVAGLFRVFQVGFEGDDGLALVGEGSDQIVGMVRQHRSLRPAARVAV